MPVQTPPHKIACNHCGWSTYRPGHGDVITPMDQHLMLNCCPRCGSRYLEMRRLSIIEQALVAPVVEMAKILRRRVR